MYRSFLLSFPKKSWIFIAQLDHSLALGFTGVYSSFASEIGVRYKSPSSSLSLNRLILASASDFESCCSFYEFARPVSLPSVFKLWLETGRSIFRLSISPWLLMTALNVLPWLLKALLMLSGLYFYFTYSSSNSRPVKFEARRWCELNSFESSRSLTFSM